MKKCPLCNSDYHKIIYYGLPAKFCKNKECNCLFGIWDWLLDFLPFNGMLFTYEGNYFFALWKRLIMGIYDV